jgi:hypothetical protein
LFHPPSLDGVNGTFLLCANRTLSFCADTEPSIPHFESYLRVTVFLF